MAASAHFRRFVCRNRSRDWVRGAVTVVVSRMVVSRMAGLRSRRPPRPCITFLETVSVIPRVPGNRTGVTRRGVLQHGFWFPGTSMYEQSVSKNVRGGAGWRACDRGAPLIPPPHSTNPTASPCPPRATRREYEYRTNVRTRVESPQENSTDRYPRIASSRAQVSDLTPTVEINQDSSRLVPKLQARLHRPAGE